MNQKHDPIDVFSLCDAVPHVTDTKLNRPQTSPQEPWEETWFIDSCGQKIEQTFCFIPSNKGGTQWVNQACDK